VCVAAAAAAAAAAALLLPVCLFAFPSRTSSLLVAWYKKDGAAVLLLFNYVCVCVWVSVCVAYTQH
jgi:hypothetical protein